jgi:serine/threonine protein kinase
VHSLNAHILRTIIQGKLYIITEYASNGNLHDYIKRHKHKLPEELIWKLFMQARQANVTQQGVVPLRLGGGGMVEGRNARLNSPSRCDDIHGAAMPPRCRSCWGSTTCTPARSCTVTLRV